MLKTQSLQLRILTTMTRRNQVSLQPADRPALGSNCISKSSAPAHAYYLFDAGDDMVFLCNSSQIIKAYEQAPFLDVSADVSVVSDASGSDEVVTAACKSDTAQNASCNVTAEVVKNCCPADRLKELEPAACSDRVRRSSSKINVKSPLRATNDVDTTARETSGGIQSSSADQKTVLSDLSTRIKKIFEQQESKGRVNSATGIKCRACGGLSFDTMNLYKLHYRNYHARLLCGVCQTTVTGHLALGEHGRANHPGTPIYKKVCLTTNHWRSLPN
jgi:hypothetical protein